MARYCGTSFTPGAKLNASSRISILILFLRFMRTESSVHAADHALRAARLEQVLVQILRVGVAHVLERSQELDCLARLHGLELRGEGIDSAHDLASPSGFILGRGDESLLDAGVSLELLLVECRFAEDRADVEAFSRNPIHDLAALVRTERPNAFVEDVNVIAAAAREHDSHRLFLKAEIGPEKVIIQMQDLQTDRLEHLRIGHLRGVREVVRVEVEDQVRAEPTFLLHRRRVRGLVICARIVRVRRDPARQERSKVLLPRESEMPLHNAGGPEHETELAAAETVWKRRLGSIVVAVELAPQELRPRPPRAIRAPPRPPP